MSQAVYTRSKRFRFVEKSGSEVGAGTGFPLRVTGTPKERLDKLAELFYRVKDARYTGGSITLSEESTVNIYPPTTTSSMLAKYVPTVDEYVVRGYTTRVSSGLATLPTAVLPFFGDAYDRGDGTNWRDIASKERGLTLPGSSTILPEWNSEDVRTTAFSFESFMPEDIFPATPPQDTDLWRVVLDATIDDGDYFIGNQAKAVFTGEVAIVGGGIFDPATEFYIGFRFDLIGSSFFSFQPVISTFLDPVDFSPSSPCNYVIRLASGDLTCPIYRTAAFFFIDGDATGTDIIHAAHEWWPYSTVGGPVWDSGTGAKI